MNKKILMLMVLSVFMFSLVSAEISCTNPGLPNPQEVDIETNLIQTCDTCTYVNISSITTPTTTTYLDDSMDKNGLTYNYSYAPSEIGHYYYSVYGDKDGSITEETLCFEVTSTGEGTNTTQGLVLLAQLGVIALLFGLGRVFDSKKWKIKMFFDMLAALMTMILINSLKIVSSQSFKLNKMAELGFIIGIVLVGFLFLYLFVYATIEVIQYFKAKKKKKWDIQ